MGEGLKRARAAAKATQKGKTLLKGHTLIGEGRIVGNYGWSTGGVGIGGCNCGARSPELDSASARKRWHKQHKDDVRKECHEQAAY